MKKIKLIFLIILLFILNICVIQAKCNNSYLSDLRSLATNINFSYDYYIENDEVLFNVTINNIVPNMYIIDGENNLKYTYDNTNNGEITLSGYKDLNKLSYSVYAVGEDCDGKKLITKNILLPNYNKYYNTDVCRGIEEFAMCNKWTKQVISYNTLIEQTDKYRKSLETKDDTKNSEINVKEDFIDKVINYYAKYYYIALIVIIVLCLVVILYQNKKNRFKL